MSDPNPQKLADARAACDPSVVWVGGPAEVWAPVFYAVGARGFTSGLINVGPERSVAIHAALEAANYAAANTLIDGMRVFEEIPAEEMGGTNVTGVKVVLCRAGAELRSDTSPVSVAAYQRAAATTRRLSGGE